MNTKLDFETIDMLSKAITQFAFRSGPVEELHANNQLSQKDMKALNKFMVNRIAGLLTVSSKGDIANVLKVLTFYASQQNTFTPQIGIYASRIQRILASATVA